MNRWLAGGVNPLKSPRHHRLSSALSCFEVSLLLAPLCFAGCVHSNLLTAGSAATAIRQDATSPVGRKLLADVADAALHVGLDLAAGHDSAAALAGIQGAASALRDYEGLPVAPASATVARAAAAGSGVTRVAAVLLPEVQSLVENARQTAARQNLHVTADDITEALARGFDSVADARTVPPSP